MTTEIMQNLKEAVINYNPDDAKLWAERAVEAGLDPIKSLDALTEAIRKVGDDYERGDAWLPDLVGAADALQSALPVIEDDIKRRGSVRESLGNVVIGTVKGDIHTIGKMMVSTFLTAAGFAVYDLGVDVDAQQFMDGVAKYKADVLAMSALLTFTAPEQKRVVQALEEAGIRNQVKVVVGGGAITGSFAESIGADGYAPAAPLSVGLVKQLLGIE
jgi:methanogenic corrinoid protein MtbC1